MSIIRLPTTLCVRRESGGGASRELARPAFLVFRAFLAMGARI